MDAAMNTAAAPAALPTHPSSALFDAVVRKDCQGLLKLYASHARGSVVSYLSMKTRWNTGNIQPPSPESYRSEEKLDEFLQHLSDSPKGLSPISASRREDDTSYYYLLNEFAAIMNKKSDPGKGELDHVPALVSVSTEAERLLWESSAVLSDSRPPPDLMVYNREGSTTPPSTSDGTSSNISSSSNGPPPIFDGNVANSTPPHLGGAAAGASGGAGTALHLACAMDSPLILAFLLCMGADARACHTAFRRLVIHEAACNGSVQCLRLLLEMGRKFADDVKPVNRHDVSATALPFFPEALPNHTMAGAEPRAQVPVSLSFRNFRRVLPPKESSSMDFLTLLNTFENCYTRVQLGLQSELDAARVLIRNAWFIDTTKSSIVRSCSFGPDAYCLGMLPRSFLRPHGCADGHGNTPLHWAAFKNEVGCVKLLLEYNADANARAHPSGWTPLHDAAYSNSSESIVLLVQSGAHVDARANSGATPLCFAAQEDAADAARLLLEQGADLSARCAGGPNRDEANVLTPTHPHSRFSGYTPLHYCAHYNAHSAAKVLLKDPASKIAMETPDLSDRLPIHVAVARGSSDVLRELLHAGARIDIGAPSSTNDTPSPHAILPATRAVTPRIPRRPPVPEDPPASPVPSESPGTPVSSPVLRSMIPSQPITSSKPWNCLSQQAIDECRELIGKAEQSWAPDRHLLFTPQDRKCVMELLRVGKRLEQQGTGIFVDLWPLVLSFCGRGWFEVQSEQKRLPIVTPSGIARRISYDSNDFEDSTNTDEDLDDDVDNSDHYLDLPVLS